MRENRPYGSEGGEPQTNAASLPLSNRPSSVELVSPIARSDAPAVASYGFRLFLRAATVVSGSDRLGTMDLPIAMVKQITVLIT
jgi:hypothetical protein